MNPRTLVTNSRTGSKAALEAALVQWLSGRDEEAGVWRLDGVELPEEMLADDLGTGNAGIEKWIVPFCDAHGLAFHEVSDRGVYVFSRKEGKI